MDQSLNVSPKLVKVCRLRARRPKKELFPLSNFVSLNCLWIIAEVYQSQSTLECYVSR